MPRQLLKFWVLSTILWVQFRGQECCLEEERNGLLELKAFVKSDGYDSDRLLPSWVDEKQSNCCTWEGVTCNSTTGHVTDLFLSNARQIDTDIESMFDSSEYEWYFNVSLFQPFKELRSLNLSYNKIWGWAQNQGFGSLLRLEVLDLAGNYFSSSVLQSLRRLTSLKNLILHFNMLIGPFPAKELSVFENLEELDLSFNGLSDPKVFPKLSKLKYLDLSMNAFGKDGMRFFPSLPSLKYLDLTDNKLVGSLTRQELANLSNVEVLRLGINHLNGTLPFQELMTFGRLKELDLSYNQFSGSIPPSIEALPSLRALSLSNNALIGVVPSPGLCELKRLQKLDLSWNSFEGILPPCLDNLRSLRHFDLSGNQFTGTLSSHLILSLLALEYLDVSHNRFEGSFSLSSIANLTELKVVKFISDNGKLKIKGESAGWNPSFQLETLVLSNCNLDNIPHFLLYQQRLRVVDLSHNKLNGTFPVWLLENNTELEWLHLRNNSFSGQFYLPPYLSKKVVRVDVSDNHLGRQLQENFGKIPPNLRHINLSKNCFEGDLPSSFGSMKKLERLDLSFNKFSGEVPKDLVAGCTNLQILRLSGNKFHGEIFSSHFNLSNIGDLELRDNQFTGTLSNAKFNNLMFLDVSNNKMTGKIPSWIPKGISALAMRNNHFEGHFPCEHLLHLEYLDLSHNFLSGQLPSCFGENLKQVHLQGNQFTGSIPSTLVNSSSLLILNIRDNNLSGRIPDLIGSLPKLRILLLGKNHFDGVIPEKLCELRNMSILDLSSNSLSGSIPFCLSNVTFGIPSNDDLRFAKRVTLRDDPSLESMDKDPLRQIVPYKGDMLPQGPVEIEFVTKNILNLYEGDVLNFMSGLDLSCNMLTGRIPEKFGKLSQVHALNLSHNHLTGSIPVSLSDLSQIESLDLSYNNLSGEIPSELINLNFLAVFSVQHNNLSGKVPDMKAQFGTLGSSSYLGNPYLCGAPLEKNCSTVFDTSNSPASSNETEGKWYEIDSVVFYASFATAYVVFLLASLTVLYINPYWRWRLLNFAENLNYLVVDAFYQLSCFYH